jgi:hypothetical protein
MDELLAAEAKSCSSSSITWRLKERQSYRSAMMRTAPALSGAAPAAIKLQHRLRSSQISYRQLSSSNDSTSEGFKCTSLPYTKSRSCAKQPSLTSASAIVLCLCSRKPPSNILLKGGEAAASTHLCALNSLPWLPMRSFTSHQLPSARILFRDSNRAALPYPPRDARGSGPEASACWDEVGIIRRFPRMRPHAILKKSWGRHNNLRMSRRTTRARAVPKTARRGDWEKNSRADRHSDEAPPRRCCWARAARPPTRARAMENEHSSNRLAALPPPPPPDEGSGGAIDRDRSLRE